MVEQSQAKQSARFSEKPPTSGNRRTNFNTDLASSGGQSQGVVAATSVRSNGINGRQNTSAEHKNQGDIKLVPKQIYGVDPSVNPGVISLNENLIAYVCGHNIILYNLKTKQSQFTPGIEGCYGITAMAVSHNGRFLAVCEKAKQPLCVIYELKVEKGDQYLKRRRVLTTSETSANEFKEVAFAYSDDKMTNFLLTVTGKPDYRVMIWLWDKQKFVQQVHFDGSDIAKNIIPASASFNPFNQSWEAQCGLLITGQNCFKYYRMGIENNQLILRHDKLTKKDQLGFSTNYTAHAWLDQHLLVCTDAGEILFCDCAADFKMMLIDSPQNQFNIQNICALKNDDFFIADNRGQFMFFESTGEMKKPYRLSQSALPVCVDTEDSQWGHILQKQEGQPHLPITSMTQAGEWLIYTTVKKQLLKMRIQKSKPEEFGTIGYLTTPFHRHAITGMTTCLKAPILITSSTDNVLMLWHYSGPSSSLKLHHVAHLSEAVKAIALHPSGMYLLVAHFDSVKHYSVFGGDQGFKAYHSLPIKGVSQVQFANGGHTYLTNDGENNIHLVKFYEGAVSQTFEGHKTKVQQIAWLDDDSGFVSTGSDKQVIYWKVKPSVGQTNPIWTYSDENTLFQGVIAVKEESEKQNQAPKVVAYVSGSDGSIQEIVEGERRLKFHSNQPYSQIKMLHGMKAFFAGGCQKGVPGAVSVVMHPNYSIGFELQMHQQAVTCLQLSYEHSVLFSGSEDGSIAFMQVIDHDSRPKCLPPSIAHSSLVLIQGQVRRNLIRECQEKQSALNERNEINRRTMHNKMNNFQLTIGTLQEEIASNEFNGTAQINQITQEKEYALHSFGERRRIEIDQHKRDLLIMRQENERKMAKDEEKLQALMEEKELQAAEWLEIIELQKSKQEKSLEEDKNSFAQEMMAFDEERARLEQVINNMELEAKKMRGGEEEKAWEKINHLTDNKQVMLASEIEYGLQSKAELTKEVVILREKNTERNDKQKELDDLVNQIDSTVKQQADQKSDIEVYKKQNEQRDVTIEEKKIQSAELRKKIMELEKFKFVLDYKIKELRRKIGPKTDAIKNLEEQTERMRAEQKYFHRVNQNMLLILDDLKMRQEGLTRATTRMDQTIEQQNAIVRQFKEDLYQTLSKNAQDNFKELKRGVIRLYRTWVLQERDSSHGVTDHYKKFIERRKQLENSIKTLEQKLLKNKQKHSDESQKILKENVLLIKEINQLKLEEQKLKIQVKHAEMLTMRFRGGPQNRRLQSAMPGKNRLMSAMGNQKFRKSNQNFQQKKQRIQSAMPGRGREIGTLQREQEQMMNEERLLQIELQETIQRNSQLRQAIADKQASLVAQNNEMMQEEQPEQPEELNQEVNGRDTAGFEPELSENNNVNQMDRQLVAGAHLNQNDQEGAQQAPDFENVDPNSRVRNAVHNEQLPDGAAGDQQEDLDEQNDQQILEEKQLQVEQEVVVATDMFNRRVSPEEEEADQEAPQEEQDKAEDEEAHQIN